MRRLLSAFAIVGAFVAQPALAQKHCAAPADQAVFEVQALRTQLRVLAIQCTAESRWAAFVGRYQTELSANDKSVTAWFKRHYGSRGQQQSDRYVTDLANAISTSDNTLGSDLCGHEGLEFSEAMALRSGADLVAYAAAKDLVPASIDVCPGEHVPAPTPARKR